MTQAPPTPLAAGSYQKGALIGLGKTASWDYPYVRLLMNWTCVSYPNTNQYTGQQETLLSVPIENQEAEYYWPQWKANIDYSNQATKPWGIWRVLHNNLYYEPTFWLSASQTGMPPSTAEAQVGDYVNKDLDGGQLRTPKTRCKNQSHPVRVWMCVGNMEENNGWNTYFGSQNFDPETGERGHDFLPAFLNEFLLDPTKVNGFGPYGGYYEQYFPNMYFGREYVSDPENSQDGPRVKPYIGTKEQVDTQNYEPVFWDGATGNMPIKDIGCGNPYVRYHTSSPLSDTNTGISINLWYQKVIFRSYGVKTSKPRWPAGNEISIKVVYDESINSTPVAESKVHLVDVNPGSGYAFFNYYFWGSFLLYGSNFTNTNGGTPPSYWYRNQGMMGLFADTNHPLVMTRKREYFVGSNTIKTTYAWHNYPNPQNLNPPPRTKVLMDTEWSVSWQKRSVQMGEDQSAVPGADKDGKYYYENKAHQLDSWTETSIDVWTELSYQGNDTNVDFIDGAWADD